MRVAVGGISHETNTFCRGESMLDRFQERAWAEGQELIDNNRGVRNYIGGIIDAAERLDIELAPTFFASATPSATIAADTYATLIGKLLDALQAAGEVDAVCLTLHGAGVAAGVDDIEGDIIQRVRELVGPDMPIVVTLDLHGNITQQMVDHADALLGVNLYPHTASYDRGVEAIELIPKLVSGEVKPVMHLTHLPMMIPST